MFKYEMHLHTIDCSKCGRATVYEMVDAACEQGYAGIVITNHFFHGNTAIDRDLPWADFVNAYKEGYLKAKEYGDQKGIDVLFGIEEGLGGGKEALIYGLSADVVAKNTDFPNLSLKQMADFVRENGGVFVCAHPYRNREYIVNPDKDPDYTCFDGVEAYNSHNSAEENGKASDFAEKHGLFKTSGGDHHSKEAFGGSGIAFKTRKK